MALFGLANTVTKNKHVDASGFSTNAASPTQYALDAFVLEMDNISTNMYFGITNMINGQTVVVVANTGAGNLYIASNYLKVNGAWVPQNATINNYMIAPAGMFAFLITSETTAIIIVVP